MMSRINALLDIGETLVYQRMIGSTHQIRVIKRGLSAYQVVQQLTFDSQVDWSKLDLDLSASEPRYPLIRHIISPMIRETVQIAADTDADEIRDWIRQHQSRWFGQQRQQAGQIVHRVIGSSDRGAVVLVQWVPDQVTLQGREEGKVSPHGREEGKVSPHGREEGKVSPQGRDEGKVSPHGRDEGKVSPQGRDEGKVSPQGRDEGRVSPQGRDEGRVSQHGRDEVYANARGTPVALVEAGTIYNSIVVDSEAETVGLALDDVVHLQQRSDDEIIGLTSVILGNDPMTDLNQGLSRLPNTSNRITLYHADELQSGSVDHDQLPETHWIEAVVNSIPSDTESKGQNFWQRQRLLKSVLAFGAIYVALFALSQLSALVFRGIGNSYADEVVILAEPLAEIRSFEQRIADRRKTLKEVNTLIRNRSNLAVVTHDFAKHFNHRVRLHSITVTDDKLLIVGLATNRDVYNQTLHAIESEKQWKIRPVNDEFLDRRTLWRDYRMASYRLLKFEWELSRVR